MTIETVFKAEAQAGLTKAIQDNVVKAATSIKSLKHINSKSDLTEKDYNIINKAKANANPGQIDLYYLETVLVSTGWNKNDDVFLPDETWAARHTPEDKMFNYMHDEGDIIGHMTGSFIEDFDGNIIPDDTPLKDIPSDFNIITPAVIYAKWSNPERQERIDAIIADIESGGDKWKVSMECLFPAFDYAAINMGTGEQLIIPRNESSASLTQHLRAYGGQGVYEDYRIGRALRRQTYSGKGLVDEPANEKSKVRKGSMTGTAANTTIVVPNSIVWNATSLDNFTTSSGTSNYDITWTVDNFKTLATNLEENEMADTNETIKQELAQAKKELNDIKAEMDQKRKEEVQAKTDELSQTISEKDTKITELEGSIADKDQEIKDLEDKLTAAETEKVEAEKTVASLEKDKLVASRKAEFISAGAEETEADSLVEEWADADDKQFARIVELVKKAAEAKFHEYDMSDDDKKKKKMEDAKKSKGSDDSDDDDASAALDDVEDDEDSSVALNSDQDEDETKTVQKSLASYFQKSSRK
jgi:hypothetical protein